MDSTLNGEFILNENSDKKLEDPKDLSNDKNTAKKQFSPSNQDTLHFYSSFCSNPKGLSFAEQHENETILLLLRRHFVTNLPWIAVSLILAVIPAIFPLIENLFPFPLPSVSTLVLLLVFYYLVLFGFILLNFTLWYFQAGLITNLRCLDVDLSGILYRQISDAKNENIEDVTYTQVGFIRSLFNYGNVLVQTAGAEENIEYDRIPKPAKVSEIIGELSQQS
jgi:hypothetical protein